MYAMCLFILLMGLSWSFVNCKPADVLGQAFYIRNVDIGGDPIGGRTIFKPFCETCNCVSRRVQEKDSYEQRYFKNSDEFYKAIITNSGIDVNFIGKYSLGFSLKAKTDSISDGQIDVSGTLIARRARDYTISLHKDCYTGPKGELNDDVLEGFDNLELKVQDPEHLSSWRRYDNFLRDYGTHIISDADIGASFKQWTSSKSSSRYTQEQMTIKSCVDFFGLQFLNVLGIEIEACATVTEAKYRHVSNIEVSTYKELLGGSKQARDNFLSQRTPELLDQLITEGRKNETVIDYKYYPIWDVLMAKYKNDPPRFAKAHNLKQYYVGYLDFGCTEIEEGGLKLRRFQHRDHSIEYEPVFECVLERKGCHSDDDCDVSSYCYGKTCVDHVPPAFGEKAEKAVIRRERSGDPNTGINTSCEKVTLCKKNIFEHKIIWKEGDPPVESNQQWYSATGKNKSSQIVFILCLLLKLFY